MKISIIDGIEYVTITKTKYEDLKSDSFKLRCLDEGGVDNWEWYGESLVKWYKKYYPEELDDIDEEDLEEMTSNERGED